ncbi:MAG: hypothetical protein DMD31_15405 [Gemmatimonadetes bacterium]|nr:MAG: hypothetical protein DMD31_15405 [Gemmatimonadota bacterium]
MNRKGFTLIELLIVVVIIGILAAIAIPKFANTKEKAYIASMKSDLRNLVTAEEAYFADSVKYSATIGPRPARSTSGRRRWRRPTKKASRSASKLDRSRKSKAASSGFLAACGF